VLGKVLEVPAVSKDVLWALEHANSGPVPFFAYLRSDLATHFANGGQGRVHAPTCAVSFSDLFRKGTGSYQEHVVWQLSDLAGENTERQTREDVGVVPLAGNVHLAVDFHGIERGATGEDGAAFSVLVSGLSSAFGLAGRVTQSHDHGAGVVLSHLFDDLLSEGRGGGRYADQARRLDGFDYINELLNEGHIMGVVQFVLLETSALLANKTAAVEHVDLFPRLLNGLAVLFRHAARDEVGNTDTSFTTSKEHESMFADLVVRGKWERGKNTSKAYSSSALDVIVESTVAFTGVFEETEGVEVSEVFELEEHVTAPFIDGSGHEFLDEFVKFWSAYTRSLRAHVVWVLQLLGGVGADIKSDWQAHLRGDASACNVQGELSNGNTHSIDTLVTEAKNTLSISENDGANVWLMPAVEDFPDVSLVLVADVKAARLAEDVREVLASSANSWGVHKWHDLFDVLNHDFEVQVLVTLLEIAKVDVLFQRACLRAELHQATGSLSIHIKRLRGHEATESELILLLLGVSIVLVEQRMAKQLPASDGLQFMR
jgi:hypothetical protein